MGKIELLKIVGNLLVKYRKLYMNGTVILMSSLKKKSRQFLLLQTDISQKTVVRCL